MKRVVIFLSIIVAGYFGANLYFGQKIEKQIQAAANSLQMMGGNLTYNKVKVNYKGDIVIDNLALFAPGMDENIRIDRAVMRSGSFMGVYKLANDFHAQRVPSQMSLSLEGMTLIVGGDVFKQMSLLSHDELLVCGEKNTLSFDDYSAMGYGSTLKMNLHLDSNLFNEGQWIVFTTRTEADGMNDTVFKMDVSLNALSRDAMAIGAAAGSAELNEIVLEYTDKGYVSRVVDYCQKQTGLSTDEYLAQLFKAWQSTLNSNGLVPGPNVTQAFEAFIRQPGNIRLTAKPMSTFNMQKMATTSPDLLLYEFLTVLEVNGQKWDRLDLRAMTEPEKTKWMAENLPEEPESSGDDIDAQLATQTRRRPVRGKPFAVTVDQLPQYVDQEVVLSLISGNRIEGKIISASNDKLVVHSYQSGGQMEIPVKVSQIRSAQIKPGLQ